MNAKELTRKQKAALLLCSVPGSCLATQLLFKHGSELVFGVQARTWAMGVVGLQVLVVAALIALLRAPEEPKP